MVAQSFVELVKNVILVKHFLCMTFVTSYLESNLTPARDIHAYFVHTNTHRPHRDWDRTMFEYLLRRYGSAVDCCRGRGSECSRPGYGISPLGGGRHYSHHRAAEITQDWGNKLLEGIQTLGTLCTPGPRRNEQWPHKRLTQTCLWVSRSL